MLNLGPVYSIGGCVVHEVAKRISKFSEGHADHFWRRPTIALMSKPIDRFHFNIHELPSAFVNYFINDASASHRREIENLPSRGSVFIDITRDIFTGVIEIEPDKFILNPLDGVDIVENLNANTINETILSKILKSDFQLISHNNDRNKFLKLWEKNIDLMIDMLSRKFDNVFILEIYFTSKIANGTNSSNIDSEYEHYVNGLLFEMYEKIRHRSDSIFVSIDQNKMITGKQVEWGGPTYTHFIEETYALFCDRVLQMMTQGKSDFSFIEEASFERARAHEKTILEFDLLQEEISKRPTHVDFEAQRVMISQKDDELEELRQTSLSHLQQIHEAQAELARSRSTQRRLEKELELARQSVFAQTRKSIARMTYRLRRGSR